MTNIDQFDAYSLPCRRPQSHYLPTYNKAYQLWRSIWEGTLQNVDGIQHLYSDEFLRNDEVLMMTYEGEAIGLFLFHWVDLQWESYLNQNAIQGWPLQSIGLLRENQIQEVMCLGSLCILPEWRKGAKRVPVADVLLHLAIHRFHLSGSDGMVAFTRNCRKVNELFCRHGAEVISRGEAHNEPSDLVLITKESSQASHLGPDQEMAEHLLENLVHLGPEKTISKSIEFHTPYPPQEEISWLEMKEMS